MSHTHGLVPTHDCVDTKNRRIMSHPRPEERFLRIPFCALWRLACPECSARAGQNVSRGSGRSRCGVVGVWSLVYRECLPAASRAVPLRIRFGEEPEEPCPFGPLVVPAPLLAASSAFSLHRVIFLASPEKLYRDAVESLHRVIYPELSLHRVAHAVGVSR